VKRKHLHRQERNKKKGDQTKRRREKGAVEKLNPQQKVQRFSNAVLLGIIMRKRQAKKKKVKLASRTGVREVNSPKPNRRLIDTEWGW